MRLLARDVVPIRKIRASSNLARLADPQVEDSRFATLRWSRIVWHLNGMNDKPARRLARIARSGKPNASRPLKHWCESWTGTLKDEEDEGGKEEGQRLAGLLRKRRREEEGKKGSRERRIACVPESIDEELFRDVVLAVGILKRQVELVVLVEHVEARLRLRSRTA